ncbi:MAG: hypothetical protein H7X85_10060 [Thermoanaerobaculia bacterium]|nr:hypothetical protein [Thermoanaerobaculia bacterium]
MRGARAVGIGAFFLLIHAPLVHPDPLPGNLTEDGGYRVRSYAHPGRALEPDLVVTRAFTPRYPDSERPSHRDHHVRVLIRVDSTGAVVLAEIPHPRPRDAAFDSASLHAARLWTWKPSTPLDRMRTVEFDYRARPVHPAGEGSAVLFFLESVARDTIEAGVGISGAAYEAGTLSFGRTWTRLDDLPPGETGITVGLADFDAGQARWTVRPNTVDTITVVLTPRQSVPPGHTIWTRPPAPFPPRAGDDARFPLEGFTFRLETDGGEVVDAARGVVTREGVGEPDVTTRLVLTPAEVDRIRRRMIEIRFFEMSDLPPSSKLWFHDTRFFLEANAGGRTKRMSWKWSDGDMTYPSDDWKRLRDLVRLIHEVVEARPEWQALLPR